MTKRHSISFAVALTGISLAGSALAAPTIFFGQNGAPGSIFTGTPATARSSFQSQVTGTGTETFSSQAVGSTAPINLTFPGSAGSLNATLNGTGIIRSTASQGPDGPQGRFNTSGATAGPVAGQWWEVLGNTFTIDFSAPIAGFGFNGTDFGDVGGNLNIALTSSAGVVSNLTLTNTVNSDGGLLFWGFIDPTTSYSRIAFTNTSGGVDGFGFDDMIIADRQQIRAVPEPAALALLGLAFLVVGFSRRRA